MKIELSGLGTLLTVLFVALKLTGHIAWSWWMVFSPLWIPFLFVLSIVFLFAVVGAHK